MRLRYGRYAGCSIAQVILSDPAYGLWWLAERPDSSLADLIRGAIHDFDAKPFQASCAECGGRASCAHVFGVRSDLLPYCQRCSLAQNPHPPVHVLAAYEDAMRHVAATCPRGQRIHMRRIVRALARLKGAPERFTEKAVAGFFGSIDG